MNSKKNDGSVAPKERINIRYVPKTDGQQSEIELPLNLLITGDTGKSDNSSLDERHAVSVNKNNFNSVISETGINLNFNVKNRLSETPDDELCVHMDLKSLDDFSPDSIAKQVPELKKLLDLREALVALKGPMGNIPQFRAQLQALLENEETREQLLKELDIVNK
ncbi:type VI secretion system contractile sheath small subunit [Enterobacter cloacae complex sp. P15RS]|uniref:Type VI secretion protein n=1 Tax=Enterobacter genomosp. S TaxID=2364151 RepID=A0ABR5YLS1_9ENTR|nr:MULTISPECIES: type VI secretion system contractile sheath small subunit [Enterobacter]RAY65875.1 type VI secretion system contractile sheath small subunit [Enterobacter hormaechei]KZR31696.1 type VI secretion protein [Enterobacter genomosp. S]MBE3469646.1 type VI secretion system contractile sheath small subunit [Enterobacter cloacae complex sp. P15RS]MBJ6386498.1 type VI secretion system contractile sheath small subunit [Enterobacter cloacae]MBJ6405614.1 type VI secretion system contractil